MELQIPYSITDSLLNHTGGYIYIQGKILISLRYEYQSDAFCLSPGEYLRYHRKFQSLSTRELAERVGIVPATLKQYEGRRSIKYETALSLAAILNIDYHYLLNSYTIFIDYPFNTLLVEIRKELHLTQTQFAGEIGVTQGAYANWEHGDRKPRLQEYKKIMSALKRLGGDAVQCPQHDEQLLHGSSRSRYGRGIVCTFETRGLMQYD